MIYIFERENLCEGRKDKILFEGSLLRGFIYYFFFLMQVSNVSGFITFFISLNNFFCLNFESYFVGEVSFILIVKG